MAIAHTHFEAIHPFRHGNGRVGRLLLPLMMAAENHVPLYFSPYIESKRAGIRLLKGRAATTGLPADHRLHGGRHGGRLVRTDLSELWANAANFGKGSAARAIDELPHYPVVTAKRLGELLDISPRKLIRPSQVEEAGILEERTGYARNRVYAAAEALGIINRPFGEEPILPRGVRA